MPTTPDSNRPSNRPYRFALAMAIALSSTACAVGGHLDPDLDVDEGEALTRGDAPPRVSRTIYYPIEGSEWISNGPHAGHTDAWDTLGASGTEIRAVADGVVRYVRNTGGSNCTSGYSCSDTNANYVVLEHNFEGFIVRSLYLHLMNEAEGSSLRCLAEGTLVRQGQVIGRMGDTGYTSPANVVHLHFQFQQVCGSYWCDSVPLSDVSAGGFIDAGIPTPGDVVGAEVPGAPSITAACDSDVSPAVPSGGGGSACADGATIAGIDVSHHQGSIDWDRVAAAGVEFAFIRVSDGLGHPDREFDRNWDEARRVGIVRGAYQFFRAGQDPIAQAELLLASMGELSTNDLPPVLDIERLDGETSAGTRAAVTAWLAHVAARTGRVPIVYTGYYFYRDALGSPDLGGNPLWIAQYGPTCPKIPAPWYRWTFHQTSESGRVDGIGGNVDTDLFNGDRAALLAMAAGGAPPSAPPPGPPPATPGMCPSGDGLYCGEAARGQNHDHLYRCSAGSYSLVEACSSGCSVAPPGSPDACTEDSTPPPPPPAACPYGNGLYCGDDGLGQNSRHLYRCTGGSYSLAEACSSGCTVAPPGSPDSCSAPATSCPYGDGLYCGDDARGQSSRFLFRCTGGSYSLVEACSSGCYVAPPGSPDRCN